ncbi:hypothetical protein HY417_03300 [Candidatus Kaiserbacteria bacterium]|nr:hypothetical protein [Candidatus Kaiserbacteria bacterium]
MSTQESMEYINKGLKVPLLDAIDKYTIILIKHERAENDTNRQSIANETAFWKGVLDAYRKDGIEVRDEWIQTMKTLNEKLWDVEEEIRNAKKNKLSNEKVGELAVQLRDSNDERVAKRAKMAEALGTDFFDTGDEIPAQTPHKLPLHETIDRLTITLLKLERLQGNKNYESFQREYDFYSKVVDAFRKDDIDVKQEWIDDMKRANGRVWDREAAIRQGRESEFGLEEMGRRTLELRDIQMQERIPAKNRVAIEIGAPFFEVKTPANHES